jgi:MshEN domain
MNLWRQNTQPVETEHVYHLADGSTKVETVQEDSESTEVEAVPGDNASTEVEAVLEDHVSPEVEPVREGNGTRADDAASAGLRRPSLATLLIEAGLASDQQIHQALEEGNHTGEKLGEVVVRRGWASESRLAQLLAEQWGIPAVDPGALSLDPLAVSRVEIGSAAELGGFPVWFDQQGIVVAVSEPNEERFAAFRERLGSVSFVVVPRSTLSELVESRLFGAKGAGANGGRDFHVQEPLDEQSVPVFDDVSRAEESPSGEVELAPTSAPAPDSLAERLRSIETEVQALEHALGDSRKTVETQEAEIVVLRNARAQDLDKIRELEAELVERGDRLEALRMKVADLSLAFEG